MRKLLLLILTLNLIVCCGCNAADTISNSDVIINMPTDNTVNGYRTENIESKPQVTVSKNETDVNSKTETTPENNIIQYCGNTNSKKFHLPDCGSVETIKEENRLYLSNRAELISLGYEPCKRCNP